MNTQQPWPNITHYAGAVQRPHDFFSDPELKRVRIELKDDGTPKTAEGQNAIAFFGELDGTSVVIRCLKRQMRWSAERYAKFNAYIADHPVASFAAATWQDQSIFANGQWWPLVRMEYVGGRPLRTYLERHRGNRDKLLALSSRWRELIGEMERQSIAHGDLQQDNVRVLDDGTLRLIDLDAVWAPPLADLPPAEAGHPNFQHPERCSTQCWGRGVDTFSALVIYLSIRALATDPDLWDIFHNDENLILTSNDFVKPMDTDIWHRLAANRDLRVRDLVSVLDQLCRQAVDTDTSLEAVLSKTAELHAQSVIPALLEEETHYKWWESTEKSVAPTLPVDWQRSFSPEERPVQRPAHSRPSLVYPQTSNPDRRMPLKGILLAVALIAIVLIVLIASIV